MSSFENLRYDVARGAAPVIGVAAITCYIGVLSWEMTHGTYDTWVTMLVFPTLVVISLPILAALARRDERAGMFPMLCLALVVKLLVSFAYYFVTKHLYGGVADVNFYSDVGLQISRAWHAHQTVHVPAVPGYGFVQIVTAAIYYVIGPTKIGAYVVFAWIGFWGLVCFDRALLIGLPHGQTRRYAKLVFFLPSLIFWSSAIGKDAWMTFGLGVASLGVAQVCARRRSGFFVVALGLTATTLVRPHLSALVVIALAGAYLLRRLPQPTVWTATTKVFGLVVLFVGGFIVFRYTAHFLHVKDFSPTSVNHVFANASASSGGGGSAIATPTSTSLLRLPWSFLSVLFRPFIVEAHNAQEAVAAIEAIVVFFLIVQSLRRTRGLGRLFRTHSYVTYCLIYLVLFVYGFASLGNLGTLSRERIQALPLLLVFACLPTVA